MRAVLPGKPQAGLQAVCTCYWENTQLIVYITGNAFVILDSPTSVLQTIYDEDSSILQAVAIDEATGKIATCTGPHVRIYTPYGQTEGALKWSLQNSISLDNSEDVVTTLSWGSTGELLVGGSSLELYSTESDAQRIWTKSLANTANFASLSYDSGYIASSGSRDRLVKIWRRLSYGSNDVNFDFTYLAHPKAITNLRWRRPYYLDQTIDNVLYTLCSDNVVRIWTVSDPHGLQIFQLWGQIDLQESLQPRSLDILKSSSVRYAFLIDGRDFSKATECAVQEANLNDSIEDHALQHLVEVANRSPEICVILDEQGNMSAWGLENVGCKSRTTSNIFNVAHVAGIKSLSAQAAGTNSHIQFYSYCSRSGSHLRILQHSFDGSIQCLETDLSRLFDPSQRSDRVVSKGVWTGHSSAIKKIVRNISGSAVVSRTDGNECIIWKHDNTSDNLRLIKQSMINTREHIHRICVLRKGAFVVFLHHESISLWDCRSSPSQLLASCPYTVPGKPLCILVLPEIERHRSIAHIATITSKMKGIVWQLKMPLDVSERSLSPNACSGQIEEFCTLDLGDADDLAYVLPVDPAGSPPVVSGFLDTFARDVAISYTNSGLLRSWTAKVDLQKRKVDWLLTCSVETGVNEPALANGSSIRKAALVNATRSELSIWDVRGAQLEYSQDFKTQDSIQDLDWTATPDDQSILAVGFRYRVMLLSQMRYDYLNKGPAWISIRDINLRDLTPHPIGDSAWLGDGDLLIGAGNQLFIYDKTVQISSSMAASLQLPLRREGKWNLFEVVARLNGPLPVFHPQFLSQCILAGKTVLVQHIILRLHQTLKYYVEGEHIDNLLGLDLQEFYSPSTDNNAILGAKKEAQSSFADFSDEEEIETLTETVASGLNQKLTKIAIPQLSGSLQILLADIIECVAIVEKQRRSLDDNAARFMLFFRQHALRKGRANEVQLSWREINWAFHSNSQDILIDVVSHQFHGRILWEQARESGLCMWVSDSTALREQFEVIARNEYAKGELKNPIDCSLFYFALKKKAVLQGLWRMASWHREQAATVRVLSNNFQDPKWKTVAMKNAYALLGKHRFEYAAAFFLLADCLKDAVNVCLNQLKDLQLAVAITRVYEGDQGPVLRQLLEEKVLPLAAQEGNRWLASWAFWMLHRKDMAVRVLISPVYTLLETPHSPDFQARLYLTDDPALVILYSQLRQKTLQTLRGAAHITPKVEWAFVLHSARLYDRMGCDLLALDLVRNWEFLLSPSPLGGLAPEADPRKMLKRRSSLVVADLPVPILGIGSHSDGQKKPPPSVFEEPEANSLLDSFGF